MGEQKYWMTAKTRASLNQFSGLPSLLALEGSKSPSSSPIPKQTAKGRITIEGQKSISSPTLISPQQAGMRTSNERGKEANQRKIRNSFSG
jgi:hypothetical protein